MMEEPKDLSRKKTTIVAKQQRFDNVMMKTTGTILWNGRLTLTKCFTLQKFVNHKTTMLIPHIVRK